jgi:hypothetical protein
LSHSTKERAKAEATSHGGGRRWFTNVKRGRSSGSQ